MSLDYDATGPHIHSRDSIPRTMWTIVIALFPALGMAVWLFGPYALYLSVATAVASALIELPFARNQFSLRRPLGDGSAFVAGLILGLSLAPTSQWWVPILGAAILVLIGKQVFGGLGNNVFNPALVARGILLLSWPNQLTSWLSPLDGTTSATPLSGLSTDYLALFLGTVPGSLGETSVIALLLGGAFLMMRGLITWRVPFSVLAGAVAAAVIFGVDPLFTVLSGSLMFAAIFMATDMVTSPTGKTSHIVYGVGCGFLTVVIRVFTTYPAGVTFAFLIMNGIAYLMDRLGADPIFGQVEKRNRRVAHAAIALGGIIGMALLLGAGFTLDSFLSRRFIEMETSSSAQSLFPGADRMIEEETRDPHVSWYGVYAGENLQGYFAAVTVTGYGGPLRVEARLDADEAIQAVRIGHHVESPTIGSWIRAGVFLSQFNNYTADTREEISDDVRSISGATISSRAVKRAVESILAARVEPEESPADDVRERLPALTDGTYEGSGRGYMGEITVEVTVEGGRVAAIRVVDHRETPTIGPPAKEDLSQRVLEQQSLSVDTVSGATGSSEGFLSAVADALSAAGGE